MASDRFSVGVVSVIFSALGFGLIPVFALHAYQTRITIPTLLFCRFSLAALIFVLFHWLQRKSLAIRARDAGHLFILGFFCYAAQAFCYFSAIRYIRPSFAVLLLYVFPIIVALYSRFLDKEKMSRAVLMAIFISGVGLLMILGTSYGVIDVRGILYALASAVVYATYVFFGHRTLDRLSPLTLITYSTLFSALGFLSIGAMTGSISFSFDPMAWVYILCLAVFSTIMGIGLLFKGVQILGPTRASILSATEPVFAVTFSAIFLLDRLGPVQVVGAMLVLSSVFIITSSRSHPQR